jgi:pimeloyl-ACP methyl ester carboxylesterase
MSASPPRRNFIFSKHTLLRLALLYLGLVALVLGCQRSFIYFPTYEPRFDEQMKIAGWREWIMPDGSFIGWIIPPRSISGETGAGTLAYAPPLLMFHGNAGSASWRSHWVDVMQSMGFGEVRILEYPGYGRRGGRPTENALIDAALQAFDLWDNELSTKAGGIAPKIYLLGESLGSGVAAAVVEARAAGVGGALLAVPYDSVLNVARARLPFLPMQWLMKDRFDSALRLKGTRVPIVIVSATRDEVIPVAHARNLRDILQQHRSPHRYIELPTALHNDLTAYASQWASPAFDFLVAPTARQNP